MTLKRLIFLILGCLCLGLGCVGIVLGQLRSIGMMPTVTMATPPSAIARRYST